jgi:hypothetical protein
MKKELKARLDAIIETQELILKHLKIKRPTTDHTRSIPKKAKKIKADS